MDTIKRAVDEVAERLKELGIDTASDEARASLQYISTSLVDEAKKTEDKRTISKNSPTTLANLAAKWIKQGLPLDGTNVVVTGANMAMVTYHGYRNKVLKNHPEARFDVQLVRQGDDFSVAKRSGQVFYNHKIKPFSTDPIIGAYCVIKTAKGEFYEELNPEQYGEMRKSSRQSYLWDKWDTEFWLKSVIKRACKRHFYDEIADIDALDNEEYGLREEGEPEKTTLDKIQAAKSIEEVKTIYGELSGAEQAAAVELVSKKLKEIRKNEGN